MQYANIGSSHLLLYVTYGEEFGLLALEILVVGLYQFHISLNIACRHNHVLALYEFALEVESVQQYWDVGLQCYEVETLLPFGIERTGSLRSDTQAEVGSVACSLGKSVGHTCMLATIDGYSAYATEESAQRPEEPLLLHKEVDLQVLGTRVEQTHYEVPVARMRCKTQDIFFGKLHTYLSTPMHALVEHRSAKTLQ